MSLVDNTPTPCNPPATPPPGAGLVTFRWYINWPIIYDAGPTPISNYDFTQSVIHNNGGKIVGVYFTDTNGNAIPGLDACGNPLSPPPPPPGGGGGGGAGDDPYGDELGAYFNELFLELSTLIDAINQLTNSQPRQIDYSACCHAIVVAIETLAKVVAKIELILTQPGTAPPPVIDLSALEAELTCICQELTALTSSSSSIPPSITDAASKIADAVANAPHTDLKPIVDAIDRYTSIIDIKQPVISYLVDQGFIDSNTAQVVQSADTGDWIIAAFRTAGWTAVTWFMAGVGYVWDGSNWVVGGSGNIVSRALATAMHDAITAEDFLFLPTVKAAVADLQAIITPTRVGKLGEVIVDPNLFLTRAVSLIVDLYLANYAVHIGDVLPGQNMATLLNKLTGLLGLEELNNVQIGPLMRHGPARVAEMQAKFLYRQELPGISTLAELRGRGLLEDADYNGLEGLTGVPPQLAVQIRDAAQHGIPVFQLARYANTGLFTDAELADEFTFSGMRKVSQHRYMAAAAYIASQPERLKLRAALQTFYANGMIADNDLVSRLDSAEHNTDRTNLVIETAQLEKQIALAKEYEAAYSREFLAGLLDAPGYQSALEALGMQPPDVAARLFRDETHLNVTTSIQAARQARAEQRATAAAERKTAIEEYRTGNSNEAVLAASLLATGLSPTQVAALTSYQVLASSGVLRWIFGLKLPPSQATLLRERVSDLTRQREIEMLTDAQYVSQLQVLNIPPRYINALQAGANAHISPKTAAILTPVATS